MNKVNIIDRLNHYDGDAVWGATAPKGLVIISKAADRDNVRAAVAQALIELEIYDHYAAMQYENADYFTDEDFNVVCGLVAAFGRDTHELEKTIWFTN